VGSNGEPAGVLYANQLAGSITEVPDIRLQNAINACQPAPGAPAVGLELAVHGSDNAFVIGPITLQPGVTLIVDVGVTVFVSTTQSYGEGVITIGANSTPYTGGAMGYWGIMGYGIIDGQGSAGYGARLIQMADNPYLSSDYFTLYKITLQNGGKMHVYGVGNNFLAYDVKVTTPADTANTDGIDPSGSYNVTIANSFISDGDDHIAIKAGVAPVSNITIAHNHLYAGHGVSVGSETNAGLTNMLVTDVAIDNNGAFGSNSKNSLRIKSADNEGGTVNDVLYNGICIENGGHLFIFDPYYGQEVGGPYVPIFQGITLQNVNVVNADQTAHNGASTLRGYTANGFDYPLIMNLDNVVFSSSNYLANQFALGNGGNSPTEYGVDDANLTLGPDPVSLNAVLDGYNGTYGMNVVDNTGGNSNPAYDCSRKFTYLAGELFGSATNISPGGPLTLTAIVQPAVPSSWTASPGYVAPAPTGTITIYDNGTQIVSQTVLPPAVSYLCRNATSLCSSQRSVNTITLPTVSAGTHVYTATYSGDPYYLPADATTGIAAAGGANGEVVPVAPTFPSFTVQATGTGTGPETWLAPKVTAASKVYDGTANEPIANVTCTLTPAENNVTCAAGAATFASTNAGAGVQVTATAIYLSGSAASSYQLASTTATTNAAITPAPPAVVMSCPKVTYDGNAHTCAGSATGVGGVTVAGTWTFSPASETAVGSYPVTGAFSSSDSDYASGGTASGTLIITAAVPVVTLTAKAIPYMTSLFAGIPNESSANTPYIPGTPCPSGGGKIALDKYGDGCLATESVMYETYAVVFDSGGNAYIANYDPAGFSFVQKVDAISGVISLFAGGLSGTTTGGYYGEGPCGLYYDPTTNNFGPDPAVASLVYASFTAGDGCPAEDPITGASYSYFKGIRDLAIDANYLYIDDSSNSKIRKVSLSSSPLPYHYYAHEVEPVAGYSGSGWTPDGPVNTVQIKNPYSVAVDKEGNVYFGDQSGNSIRRVTPTVYSAGGYTTPGNITTVLNCAGSGSTCTQPASGAICPSGSPAGASKNIKTYSVTGMAFDASGNLYYAAQHCYSVYKIAANSLGQIDGTTAVTTLVGTGVTGTNNAGGWIPAFAPTGVPQSSARSVVSAGGNNMYVINGTNAWFYDAGDTANGATNGWIHEFWNSASPVGVGCTGSVKSPATSYFGCPAPYSAFTGGTNGGKGSVDAYGNLYIADGGDNLVLKAATGLDFVGTAPQSATSGAGTQTVLIHGDGLSDSNVTTAPPFSLTGLLSYPLGGPFTSDCLASGVDPDGATDCTYSLTYTPTTVGPQTGALNANSTNLSLDGYGTIASPPLTASVSCGAKTYDETMIEPLAYCVCTLTPSVNNVSCAMTAASFSQYGVGTNLPVTVTGITLVASVPGNYTLLNTTATTTADIDPMEPYLYLYCTEVAYDGQAHACSPDSASPWGGLANGTFSCAPASETNAGSYPVTCTFTSLDPNYSSGGTVAGTLTIDVVAQSPNVTCSGPLTYDGNAHSCVITGGFGACTSASVTNAPGSIGLSLSCAGDNNHYAWSSIGAITINPATPAVTVTCPTAAYDGTVHSCTATATGVGGATVNGTFGFAPGGESVIGSYPEAVTFTSSDPNYGNGTGSSTLVINVPAAATLSTTSLTFPNPIMMGQSSPAQYVLITSTGAASLQVSSVTVGGANPGDFLVTNQAGTCATTGAVLAYHAECNLRIVFAPTAIGSRSAILYINDNVTGSPQQVLLSGTAVTGAQLSLSAATLTFSATTVGATATTQYITIKSTGFQPVVISKVVLSSGDFDLSDQAGTCTTAATTSLIPGANCNIRVKFHPTAKGVRTASVTINNNSASSPVSVSLSGTGE